MAAQNKQLEKIRAAGLVRSAGEVELVLLAAGRPIRRAAGSHKVAVLPDGRRMAYHEHGEYGSGLGRKLFKILASAGLLTMAAAIAALLT